MRVRDVPVWLGAALLLSACVSTSADNLSTTYLDRYADPNPTLASFRECHGFSCTSSSHASLTAKDWQRVAAAFQPRARDAAAERKQIGQALATMRRLVGAQTGTGVPQWTHKDMMIRPNLGDQTQLDCIDEAVNNWTYMTMMERGGLLHFHKVAVLANADSVVEPRNTAVLQEKSGTYYAVDSAVVAFGVPPLIIPLKTWREVWPPKQQVAANEARAEAQR